MSATTEAADSGEADAERVLRALRLSGRRLVQRKDGMWGVLNPAAPRRGARLAVSQALVEALAESGRLCADAHGGYVLGRRDREPPPPVQTWALLAAGTPKRNRGRGFAFLGLALQARVGRGPLTLRHVEAGMRLSADAEREASAPSLTMDWFAGPADKTRRGPGRGGQTTAAAEAARRLRRVRARIGEAAWRLAWAACVESARPSALRQQFGLPDNGAIGRELARALEAVAEAYQG